MRDALLPFWPTPENVRACIKREAETFDEAVFLAVHQPMAFVRYRVGAHEDESQRCNEHDLLEAFLEHDLPEGRLIMPITGTSGVGKSHVVRWLDAQLQRLPDAGSRHVIRVPKGSSLKGVLQTILDRLEGPAYDEIRKALRRARDELDPELATLQLQTHLRYQLTKLAEHAAQRLQDNQSSDRDRDRMRKSFGSQDALPAFIGDPVLQEKHFLRRSDGSQGVIALLAQHVTQPGDVEVDERLHQFMPNDFRLPDSIQLEELSAPARSFAKLLLGHDGKYREQAAEVLNEVLDGAKQQLLDLGDTSLQEVFIDIRKELLREGRELILLIEDFAVLSGMQGALLDVILREAVRDGDQVLCTMRTALAATSGYIRQRDTLLTRAINVWKIEDTPGSEKERLERTFNLVGAYLNAARCGREEIRTAFVYSREGTVSHEDWIPHRRPEDLDPESRSILLAFGLSKDGYPLFPYNEHAIEQFAREGSKTAAGDLAFNPRNIINNVLYPILDRRDLFARGRFPPSDDAKSLRSAELGTQVAETLQSDRGRYRALLYFWAGNPVSMEEAVCLDKNIYVAFELVPLIFGGLKPPPIPPPKPPRGPDLPTSKELSVDPRRQQIRQWEERLRDWAAGTPIDQTSARALRTALADAMVAYIHWNAHLLRISSIAADHREVRERVFIPGAGGGADRLGPDNAFIVVCDEGARIDPDRSPDVRLTLLAFAKFHYVYKYSWDYEGGEDDSARYADFLGARASTAARYMRRHYYRADYDTIPLLVEGLLIGARCLNVPSAHADDEVALLDALLQKAPDRASQGRQATPTQWDNTLQRFRETREAWQAMLLDQIGARQGDSRNNVHAVDPVRVREVLTSTRESWTLSHPSPPTALSSDAGAFREQYLRLRNDLTAAVSEETKRRMEWRKKYQAWAGADNDPKVIAEVCRRTLADARERGSVHGVDYESLKTRLEVYQAAGIKEALLNVAALTENLGDRGAVLSLLSEDHRAAIDFSNHVMATFDDFLERAEAGTKARSAGAGDDVVDKAADAVRNELDRVNEMLQRIVEVRA